MSTPHSVFLFFKFHIWYSGSNRFRYQNSLSSFGFFLLVPFLISPLLSFNYQHTQRHPILLKLNGSWRLASVVVADTADTVHRVDNARRHLSQELGAEGVGVGGHVVGRLDSTQQDNVLVHALVAHDTDGAAGVERSKGLANLVVQTSLADHGDEDVVGLAHHLDAFGGGLAQDADSDTLFTFMSAYTRDRLSNEEKQ